MEQIQGQTWNLELDGSAWWWLRYASYQITHKGTGAWVAVKTCETYKTTRHWGMAALGRGTPQERTRLWQVPSFPSFSSFDHFHPALTLGAQPPMHRLPTFRTSLVSCWRASGSRDSTRRPPPPWGRLSASARRWPCAGVRGPAW